MAEKEIEVEVTLLTLAVQTTSVWDQTMINAFVQEFQSRHTGNLNLSAAYLVSAEKITTTETIEVEDAEETVKCRYCGEQVPVATAHQHDGDWIGDECCWDERLRSSE